MIETSFTQLNEDYAVAPQMSPDEVRTAAKQGFKSLLINRPDGEGGPTQPTSQEMIELAESLGMTLKLSL